MIEKTRGKMIQLFIRLFRALQFIGPNPVTAGEIAKVSGISLRRVYRWLHAMKHEGLLEEVEPFRSSSLPGKFRLRREMLIYNNDRCVNNNISPNTEWEPSVILNMMDMEKDKNSKSPRIMQIQAEMKNEDTGETFDMDRVLFFNKSRMESLVIVKNVESNHFENDTYQVDVETEAMDTIGSVVQLELVFFPRDKDLNDKIMDDIRNGNIYKISGEYCFVEGHIQIFDPDYLLLENYNSDYDLDELKEVFQANGSKKQLVH